MPLLQAGEGEGDDGIGLRKFGDEDELGGVGRCEGVKEVCVQEGFEAAFDGHPDGLGFEEGFERVAAGRVGKVIGERADGGEQRLMDARAVGEAGLRGDFGPRDFCAHVQDLRVAGVLMRGAPGERLRDADEGMKNDKDRFEEPVDRLPPAECCREDR